MESWSPGTGEAALATVGLLSRAVPPVLKISSRFHHHHPACRRSFRRSSAAVELSQQPQQRLGASGVCVASGSSNLRHAPPPPALCAFRAGVASGHTSYALSESAPALHAATVHTFLIHFSFSASRALERTRQGAPAPAQLFAGTSPSPSPSAASSALGASPTSLSSRGSSPRRSSASSRPPKTARCAPSRRGASAGGPNEGKRVAWDANDLSSRLLPGGCRR